MAQIAQLKSKTELKCPHEAVFYFMKNNINKFTTAVPNVFKSLRVVEGEEGRSGNVVSMLYELGGRDLSLKSRTEINEDEKWIAYSVTEGDMMQIYKSLSVKFKFNENGSAEIFFEYEKADESCPNPDDYMNMALKVVRGLDAYFTKN